MMPSRLHGVVWPVLFIVVLSIGFAWPLLTRLSATGVWDWSEAAAHYEATRHTVFYHGQFPLWNPYVCGGSPALANPQTYYLSLSGLSALLFGSLAGPKIAVVVYVALGGIGMWLLVRRMGVDSLPALLAVPVYLASGFLATRLAAGQFLWLTLAWVPWVFYGYIRSRQTWWWLMLSGAALALIGLEGRTYLVVYVVVMLGVYGLYRDLVTGGRAWGAMRAFGVAALAFGLGAWKFVPDLFWLAGTTLSLENSPVLPAALLPRMFLWREASPESWYGPTSLQWVEYGAYVGLLPLALAASALLVRRTYRSLAPMLLAGIAMLALALSVPEGNILEFWPGLRDLRNYHRATGMVVFVVAILAAYGLQIAVRALGLTSVPLRRVVQWAVILFVSVDLLVVTSPALAWGFAKVAKSEGADEIRFIAASFAQASGSSNDPYRLVVTNRGAKEACPAVLYTWIDKDAGSGVVPMGDELYRGEAYVDGGTATIREFTANRLSVRVQTDQPSKLVVNQNYDSGWRASVGSVMSSDTGLLTVAVPAGNYVVELAYWPVGLTVGLVTSLAVAVVLLLLFVLRLRRRGAIHT